QEHDYLLDDVKITFLNKKLKEEVYISQPKGFIDLDCPTYVYRLKKALYGLKQAPRAWATKVEENLHITFLKNKPMIAGGGPEWLFDIDALSKSINYAPVPADIGGFTSRKKAIGTKWVYRNKRDQRGIVVRNKARLVAHGHRQEEGKDYDEVFAPVSRIKAIKLFLAYALFMDFTVYQMDVKSPFLYGTIEEEVYVSQPPSFMDPEFPDRVYEVEKALYGLHQAPKAWYETLSTYSLDNGFRKRTIDKTLFIKKIKYDILLVQVYVDGIIFGSTNRSLIKRIFRYLKGQPTLGLWYPKNSPLELIAYSDSDYACASIDRKSTTRGWQMATGKELSNLLMAGSLPKTTLPTQLVLNDVYAVQEFQHPEFKGYGPKDSKSVYVDTSNEIKNVLDALIIEDWVSDSDEDESEEMVLKSDNVQHKPEQANQPRKVSQNPRNKKNWNEMSTQKLGVGFQFNKKSCFVCGSFSHLIKDCDFHYKTMVQKPMLKNVEKGMVQREVRPVWNNAMRSNHQNFSISRRNFAPITVLNKSGIVPISTARQSSSKAAAPGNKVISAVGNQGTNAVKSAACLVWRPKIKVQDHVSKNSGSYICKGFDYVDPEGRLNSLTLRSMMDGMLPLREELKVERLLAKAQSELQNGVAERRNRTPIKAARTMLANSKLPSTFWAEAVNTVCYVQNMVLVVKAYFKTPHELFKGRSPTLSFMRPFVCHVSILNTLDQLGKFNGKLDEGIFVGYSTTSKAFRVYNIRTRKVKENLHITFLENKPVIIGGGPEWLFDINSLLKAMNYGPVPARTNSNDFAGKGASFDAGQSCMETRSSQNYILMQICKDNSLFDSSLQASNGDNKDKHGPSQASESDDQERPNADSNTKTVRPVSTATPTYADYPNDPLI
nr:copia protein [Tanacetum cinerariifolium]